MQQGSRPSFALLSAATALVGTILSGPISLIVVATTHPQPTWQGIDSFAAAYHPVQLLPFLTGFFLVGGFVALLAALRERVAPHHATRANAAIAFGAAFGAMIFTNYAIQSTLVPALARSLDPTERVVAGTLAMANPSSLAWAVEMWGYGVLGVATWMAAPAFNGGVLERWTARLFVANGPISIAAALMTALSPGWVHGGAGLLAFGIWNALIIVMTAMAAVSLSRRPLRSGASQLQTQPGRSQAEHEAHYHI